MSFTPLVSVVMPVYNAASFLNESIGSILNQTFPDFEFLIYDDGSTDNSVAIINNFIDKRIKLFRSENNRGYVHHLNEGIRKATGKYIARMDADDICECDRLEKQFVFMEGNPDVGVCGTQITIIDENGKIIRKGKHLMEDGELRVQLFFDSCFAHPSVIIRKSILEKHNLFYKSDMVPCEDYQLWNEIKKHAKLANLPDRLLRYRTHVNQITLYKGQQRIAAAALIKKNEVERFLGFHIDKTDFELHNSLVIGDYIYSQDYIIKSKLWIILLIERNRHTRQFQSQSFERQLGVIWFTLCTHAYSFRCWIIKQYFSKQIARESISIADLTKFVLKAAIGFTLRDANGIGKGRTTMNIRHFLYRLKAKVLYRSRFGEIMRSFFWTPMRVNNQFKIIYERNLNVFDKHKVDFIRDALIRERFSWENQTWNTQQDLIFECDGVVIESENGLAFVKGRKLITQTRGHSHTYLVPSITKHLMYTLFKKKYTTYDVLIHFDGFASKNLYHFFDDALNPLLMLIQSNLISLDTPVLISEKIYRINYVQYFLKTVEPFKNLNWIVQDRNEWIYADKVYKSVSSTVGWKNMYVFLDKRYKKNPQRRIFISRKPDFQRRLINTEIVEKLLYNHGFETIYSEDLTYEEQIKLFTEAKYIVALHGAGITNMIFSDVTKVHLYEIFSKDLIHPHYYWFLEVIGLCYYDALAGTSLDFSQNFEIDYLLFKTGLEKMMNNETNP